MHDTKKWHKITFPPRLSTLLVKATLDQGKCEGRKKGEKWNKIGPKCFLFNQSPTLFLFYIDRHKNTGVHAHVCMYAYIFFSGLIIKYLYHWYDIKLKQGNGLMIVHESWTTSRRISLFFLLCWKGI